MKVTPLRIRLVALAAHDGRRLPQRKPSTRLRVRSSTGIPCAPGFPGLYTQASGVICAARTLWREIVKLLV